MESSSLVVFCFFFKQKTAYEMRISDWSSDVCSSDLNLFDPMDNLESDYAKDALLTWYRLLHRGKLTSVTFGDFCHRTGLRLEYEGELVDKLPPIQRWLNRSEEHTSDIPSLMRHSYAVFCLKKKK